MEQARREIEVLREELSQVTRALAQAEQRHAQAAAGRRTQADQGERSTARDTIEHGGPCA